MRETVKIWAFYLGLVCAYVVTTGSMTLTLNKRMDSLERRIDRFEDRLEGRMDRLEVKIDTLDDKIDQFLIALAGRGDVLPAKPEGKRSGVGE